MIFVFNHRLYIQITTYFNRDSYFDYNPKYSDERYQTFEQFGQKYKYIMYVVLYGVTADVVFHF